MPVMSGSAVREKKKKNTHIGKVATSVCPPLGLRILMSTVLKLRSRSTQLETLEHLVKFDVSAHTNGYLAYRFGVLVSTVD